jgi:NAD(P)-dependent dehydrogenase (short-subunit alcohol dehydrogenase family)
MDKNKYILITGASSGIGREIAVGLSPGYNIVLLGRDSEKLEMTKSLCDKLKSQIIFRFDLKNLIIIEEELEKFLKENDIEISHFIHGAGFMKMLPLKSTSLEAIQTTFSTNVISAALIIKVLSLRKLNKDALRNIIFISSNISNFGAKAFSIYGASKGALDAMMKSLAVELAPKVRVNSVLPGAIRTEMTQNIFENEEAIEKMVRTYPLGLGEPKDIFEMVNFLVSEKSKWITGQQFVVDGGRTINISG